MNKNNIFICVTLLFVLLCSFTPQKISLKKEKELSINVGFTSRFEGTYYDKTLNKDLFYYSDVVTYDCVKIFDDDFRLIRAIKLDNIPYLDMARDLEVISNDSILITVGNPVQLIYVVNFEGKIINRIFTRKLQGIDTNNYTMDVALFYKKIYANSKVYLKHRPYRDVNKYYLDYGYASKIDSILMVSPYIASINLDTNSTKINKLFYSIYKENYDYGDVIDDMANYCIANNKLFLPILHNGKIYVIDLFTDNIEKVFTLSSKYTNIGFVNKKKTRSNYIEVSDQILETQLYYSGGFSNIIWDKYRKLYYIIITHETKERLKSKTFSVQVCDEKFNKIGEYKFDFKKYDIYNLQVCKDGLLIKTNQQDKEYDKKICKYNLFSIVNY